MTTCFMATLDPGDSVLVPDPGWPNSAMAIEGLHAKAVPYRLSPSAGWLPDMGSLEQAVASSDGRAKMLLINTPSNPTGAVYPKETLQELIDFAGRHDLFVLSDEIYGDVALGPRQQGGDGGRTTGHSTDEEEEEEEGEEGKLQAPPATGPPRCPSALDCDFDPETLLVIGGVAKSHAMTGFRVGWVRGHPEVIDVGSKLQEPFVSCGVPFSQAGAVAALEADEQQGDGGAEGGGGGVRGPGRRGSISLTMSAAYTERRDAALAVLEAHGIEPAYVPSGAFYMLVPIPTDDSVSFCARLLRERQVAVAPGATFGESCAGFVRVAFASSIDDVEEGIARLCKQIVAER